MNITKQDKAENQPPCRDPIYRVRYTDYGLLEYAFLSICCAVVTALLTLTLFVWPFSLFFVLWIWPLSEMLTFTFGCLVLIKAHTRPDMKKGPVRLAMLSLLIGLLCAPLCLVLILSMFHV